MASNTFNHTAVYEAEIEPLVQQVHDLCKEHGIPFMAQYQLSAEDDGNYIHTIRHTAGKVEHLDPQLQMSMTIRGIAQALEAGELTPETLPEPVAHFMYFVHQGLQHIHQTQQVH